MSNLNKYIVILGAAESGTGAAVLAQKQGFKVFVSELGKIKPSYSEVLKAYSIEFEEEKHSEEKILAADEIIISPGIPDKADIVQKITDSGIPLISEIEFAARFTKAKLIGVTGSNGKTTTSTIIYNLLKNAGLNTALAGNIGKSFAWSVAVDDFDYYVLEISSFQLDRMYHCRLNTAIITNITPDHLDRYEYDFQKYIDSKFRITQNQKKEDSFIYNADDKVISKEIEKRALQSRMLPFSFHGRKSEEAAWVENNKIFINIHNDLTDMTIEQLALQGRHNVYNSMAGGISARLEGIRKESIRQSLYAMETIEHRLENVATVRGVEFINDSKATNVNSVWYALESMNKQVVWMAGGIDKGNDYSELFDLVKQKVKAIVCIGVDNSKIIDAFSGLVPEIIEAESINQAVENAFYLSQPGDVVLLSPACASFDMFENYEERGKKFKRAVQDL